MMHDLGLLVVGAAARASGLALVGLLALAVVRRRGPAAGATAGLATLVVMVGVSTLAATPWAGWSLPTDLVAPLRPAASGVGAAPVEAGGPAGLGRSAGLASPSGVVPSAWDGFAEAFRRELARPPAVPGTSPGWRWPAWLAGAFLVGLALASFRLALGLGAVRSLRRSGRPIAEPDLLGLVADLQSRLGLVRPVEARETGLIATPATVGWRRPVVLLPNHWRDWTDAERRAVLAHELAHVHRGDYLAGLLAQVSLAMHFYHPLAHALVRRLHLHQELAADAWGASLAGGRLSYLRTLANLALSQDGRSSAWPARPFLPARGTFLRRIEMLRDPKVLDPSPMPGRNRALIVASLVAAGLLLAGLRGPGTADRALAQAASAPAAPKPTLGVIDPTTLGADVEMVVDFRPGDLLKNPDFRKLAEQVPADSKEFKAIASGAIEQVLLLGAVVQGERQPYSRFLEVFRSAQPFDWKQIIPANAERVERAGMTYLKQGGGSNATCYRVVDDRTLVMGLEDGLKLYTPELARPARPHDWDDAWKRLAPGTVRIAATTGWFARPGTELGLLAGPAGLEMIAPLIKQTRAVAINLTVQMGMTLDALTVSSRPDDARRVAATLQALVTLGQNAMPNLKAMAQQGPAEAGRTLVDAADAMGKMLDTARVEQDGATTRFRAQVDSVAPLTALLVPAVMASGEATRRSQSVNNLKQIGLAMHNFASAQEGDPRFPPAVLISPQGEPYSWRVALLPHLGEKKLYDDYKFDEPWDGPNNRKLIERMPAVFRDPGDDEAQPGHASYFAPTGPGTAFPHRAEGMKLAEMTDGTSNTILVVEARRPIAWTEPEDIVILPDGPLPVFGGNHPGGYNALFADGSVRFLKDTISVALLRALISAAGGEVLTPDMK